MLTVGFHRCSSSGWRSSLLSQDCWVFKKACQILSNVFLHLSTVLYSTDKVLTVTYLNQWLMNEWLMLIQVHISGIYPTWSWCINLFTCCQIQFASNWLRIFASIFKRDIGLQFSCDVFFWFIIREMVASLNESGNVPA